MILCRCNFKKYTIVFEYILEIFRKTAKENSEIYDTHVLNKIDLAGSILQKVEK